MVYILPSLTQNRSISMGVCCQNSDPHGHAGWPLSAGVGYHSDDGGLFLNSGSSLHKGSIWDLGDVVGCLMEMRDMNRTIQFIHNGNKTGKRPYAIQSSLKDIMFIRLEFDTANGWQDQH
jgi:hypothetical protein